MKFCFEEIGIIKSFLRNNFGNDFIWWEITNHSGVANASKKCNSLSKIYVEIDSCGSFIFFVCFIAFLFFFVAERCNLNNGRVQILFGGFFPFTSNLWDFFRHYLLPTLDIMTYNFPKLSIISEIFQFPSWEFPKLRVYNIKHILTKSCFQLWPA